MGLQSFGSPNLRNFGTPNLGVPWQNDIWVLAPWPSTENTIRGKVVASPKFGSWWVLWICVCPWLVRALKCSNYALTNLLFGLCRSVWVINLLVILPNPYPKALPRPSTPEVLWIEECTPNCSFFHCVHLGLTFESIKELGSVSLLNLMTSFKSLIHGVICNKCVIFWMFTPFMAWKGCFNTLKGLIMDDCYEFR
jgi:hypothetical protein